MPRLPGQYYITNHQSHHPRPPLHDLHLVLPTYDTPQSRPSRVASYKFPPTTSYKKHRIHPLRHWTVKESCRIGDLIIDATLDDAASEGHDRYVVVQTPRLQPWDLCGRTLAKVHLLRSLDVRIASLMEN